MHLRIPTYINEERKSYVLCHTARNKYLNYFLSGRSIVENQVRNDCSLNNSEKLPFLSPFESQITTFDTLVSNIS